MRDTDVVDHGVAGDMRERVGRRDAGRGAPDDDAERGPHLEFFRIGGHRHGHAMPDDGVAGLDVEHGRARRRLVRGFIYAPAERGERVAMVQQRAVNGAAHRRQEGRAEAIGSQGLPLRRRGLHRQRPALQLGERLGQHVKHRVASARNIGFQD